MVDYSSPLTRIWISARTLAVTAREVCEGKNTRVLTGFVHREGTVDHDGIAAALCDK